MKRLTMLFSTLVLLGVIAVVLWFGHVLSPQKATLPQQQAFNLPPRPLTSEEQAGFIKLVCGDATGPSGGYAHQCQSLPGYPSSDYGGAGLGLGITLQNVIYGHLTSPTSNEAYVTYEASFEPHVNNYGGGILFVKNADQWTLKAWYPGGQASACILLTPTGRARFICLDHWEGQGESDSLLRLQTLPPPQGDHPALLHGRDLRDTLTPNANCENLSPGENILLSINTLIPTATGAEAKISYVGTKAAQTACATSQFANAPVTNATLQLRWHNDHLGITPPLTFAASP